MYIPHVLLTYVRLISSMLINRFTYSLILLFINSLVRSLTYWLTYWLINWSVDLFVAGMLLLLHVVRKSPGAMVASMRSENKKGSLCRSLSRFHTLSVSLPVSLFFFFSISYPPSSSLSISFLSFFVLFFLSYPLSSSLSVSLALSSTPLAMKWAFSIILC